jgi:hypothetical protein
MRQEEDRSLERIEGGLKKKRGDLKRNDTKVMVEVAMVLGLATQ